MPMARPQIAVAVVVASAAVIAIFVAIGAAIGAHAILVALVGEDGIAARDDTMLMFVLVGGCYGLGAAAALTTVVYGYRRLIRPTQARDRRRP